VARWIRGEWHSPRAVTGLQPDWETLDAFAHRPKAVDRAHLRVLLASVLRARGHDLVVIEDSMPGPEGVDSYVPGAISMMMFWGLGAGLGVKLGAEWWLWPVFAVAVVLISGILLQGIGPRLSGLIAGLLLLTWLGVAATEVGDGLATLAESHLVPLVLVTAYGFASRSLRLRDAQDVAMALGGVARAAPLLGPLVLVVLFLPALSNNLWQIADALNGGSFVAVGLLSVGFLLWVVRSQLGRELEPVLRQRAAILSDDQTRVELTRGEATRGLDDNSRALLDGMSDDALDAAWPSAGEEYAPYLTAA
jgi:hypothetical protein